MAAQCAVGVLMSREYLQDVSARTDETESTSRFPVGLKLTRYGSGGTLPLPPFRLQYLSPLPAAEGMVRSGSSYSDRAMFRQAGCGSRVCNGPQPGGAGVHGACV